MTKHEFMLRLDRALADLPLEERRQHLRYYRELIEDMQEDGLSEAEAVWRLGDAEAIAADILAQTETDTPERPAGIGTRNLIICAGVLLLCVVVTCIKLGISLFRHNAFMGAAEVTVEETMPEPTPAPDIGGVIADLMGEVFPDLSDYEAWDNPYSAEGCYTISAAGIDALDINWAAGDVNISLYEGDEIIVMEDCVSREQALRWGMRDGCLYIQYCDKNARGGLPAKYLDIQLPYTLAENLEEVEISTISAYVNLMGLQTRHLSMDSVSGDLYAYEVNGRELEVFTVSGWVDISGGFDRVELASTSGDVNYYGTRCPANLEAELVSGCIYLNIPEDDGFTLEYETVSGELYDGFNLSHTMDGDEYVIRTGSGAAEISVETVSGDLSLYPMY